MSKIRINDLARELEVKSKAILDALPKVGVTEKKTHSSSIEDHEAELVRKYIHEHGTEDSPRRRSAASEDEFKPKIDLSKISKPGDVLKAITQKAAPPPPPPPPPRPAVKPPSPVPQEARPPQPPAQKPAVFAQPPRPAAEVPVAEPP